MIGMSLSQPDFIIINTHEYWIIWLNNVYAFLFKDDLAKWAEVTGAKAGDLICVLSGETNKVSRGHPSIDRLITIHWINYFKIHARQIIPT